jgi:protoporphyrinogen oxidase
MGRTVSKVVILGAGLAGLSAAHRLKAGYRLVEKEERPGGLARTDVRDGFLFDRTGHWLHLRTPEVKKLVASVLPGGMKEHERNAAIRSQGVYTRYPFQANLFGLPAETVSECLIDFVNARLRPPSRKGATFERWILDTFGAGIARHFMLPYNTKIWTLPPSELSSGFCEKYIPIPSVEDIVRGSFGLSREALGYNARYIYPVKGGIESLPRAIASRLAIPPELGRRPVEVDWKRRVVAFDDGSSTGYKALISTIPLPELAGLLKDPPADVARAAKMLRATTVTYFNIAAKKPGPNRYSWVYFPEDEFAYYRIGSYSACYEGNTPKDMASFYVEYSHLGGKDARPALSECLDQMANVGLLSSRDDVLFTEERSIYPAYVLYDACYDRAMGTIFPFLKKARILPAGRYGRWGYSAMEDAMLEGMQAAARARAF